ncbi:hypothetical protein EI77_00776 [Prosthecobacter fusiformis]|uniref:Uncharacterized protein n=1 Tax=Prosthecobacter fusiformis TaxID=48464 RepID=A0A4R7ST72_9BACT|nr:hypothetical protein EI77_00776 [Prosthecobacter fusiformis]
MLFKIWQNAWSRKDGKTFGFNLRESFNFQLRDFKADTVWKMTEIIM